MLAHVGCVHCAWWVQGNIRKVPALHAVCVDPLSQGRGLGRVVMEAALRDLDDQGAKQVVLWSEKVDFYKRFGFSPVPESVFDYAAPVRVPCEARLLELTHASALHFLRQLLRARAPVSEHLAANDDGWHFLINLALSGSLAPRLLHLPNHDAVVAGTLEGDALVLRDVIAPRLPTLETIIGAFAGHDVGSIARGQLQFSPDRMAPEGYEVAPHPEEVLPLVRGAPVVGYCRLLDPNQ